MADINVTPLVDVMLVLLIIFMVTAPLLTAGVPVNLPDSRAKALDQEKQPIELSIDDQGRLFIDKDEVSEADLPAKLDAIANKAAGQDQPPQIYLRADRGQVVAHPGVVGTEVPGGGAVVHRQVEHEAQGEPRVGQS